MLQEEPRTPTRDGLELQTLARGGALSLGGMIANSLATFGFFVFAGRSLGPTNAGALFEGISVLTICSYAAMFGGDFGILKLMPKVQRESTGSELRLVVAALVPPIVIGAAICAALLATRADIVHAIVRRGNRGATAEVLAVMAPFVPLGAVMAVATAGMRTFSIRDMVIVQNLFVPCLRLGLLAVLAIVSVTPMVAAVAWTAPTAVGALVACGYLFRKCRTDQRYVDARQDGAGKRAVALELWRFSGPRSLSGIFQIMIAWLDVLLVGAMASSSQSAAYAVASRYVITATFALNAMGIAIAPQLGRLFDRNETDTAQVIYRESTWWVMAATWPALGIMVAYAPFMMHIFGRGYAAGVTSLEILGLAMLLNAGTGNNAIALLMGGGTKENLGVNTISLLLNVGLNLILIPRLGAEGAALAWAASIAFTSSVTSLLLYRRRRLMPFGNGYAIITVAAITAYGVVAFGSRLLFGAGLGPTLVGTAVSTTVFVAILIRFRSTLRFSDFRRLAFSPGTSATTPSQAD